MELKKSASSPCSSAALPRRAEFPLNADNMIRPRPCYFSVWLFIVPIACVVLHRSQALQTTGLLPEEPTTNQISAVPSFYFPNAKQAENIHPRLNGRILVTLDTAPELWQINPYQNQTGGLVHVFEDKTALFDIVELTPDVFYIIASNFTGPPDYYGSPGTVSIFEVDLCGILDPTVSPSTAKVSRVLDIPDAQLFDGLVVINQAKGLLMSGDAQEGTLYLIDIKKREASAVLSDIALIGTAQAAAAGLAHIGVNGLKFHNGELYFTNTAKGIYGRMSINTTTG